MKNLNGHINGKYNLISIWIYRLKKSYLQGKWQNHFALFQQFLLSVENYLNEKSNFYYHIFSKKISNQCKKLISIAQGPPSFPQFAWATQILKFSLVGGVSKLVLHEEGVHVLWGTYFLREDKTFGCLRDN